MPDSVRLLPVLDRLRYGQSPGAQRLAYLRALADELDQLPAYRQLSPDYDRKHFDTAMQLREQGAYLIESGF